MNIQKKTRTTGITALLAALTMTGATAFGLTPEMVLVSGSNAADPATGRGKVDYDYYIGTTEVTNSQYVAFLNAVATADTPVSQSLFSTTGSVYYGITRTTLEGEGGGYSYSLKSADYASKPVTFVSFWDAARFVNWLSTGNTETGVYNLGGIVNPTDSSSITRDQAAWEAGGWAIASENEWYKAAYYDPNKDGDGVGGYWAYPTQSDGISKDVANYDNKSAPTQADDLKNVGSYTDGTSYFGTYDQGGNVWEWTDEIYSTDWHVMRGGSFGNGSSFLSAASGRVAVLSASEDYSYGFRVVSLTAVPEPGTWAGAAGLAVLVFGVWVRQGRRTL
jgi:formylglycine-generating enzyme required for sulfatase activity